MNPILELFYGPPVLDPFDILELALADGTVANQTDSKIVIKDEAGNKITFLGDLTPGGEVTEFKVKSQGIKVAQAEGLDIDPVALAAALQTGDPANAVTALFPTDDLMIKGSPYGDQFQGLGGDGMVVKGRGGDDWLFGEDGNQTLKGGKGDDILGGGGEKDKLYGGKDDDTFVFNPGSGGGSELEEVFVHRIKDFSHEDDTILLTNAGDLFSGPLNKDAFVKGTEATTEDHRVIYDKATGSLYFDGDGSGGLADAFKFGKVDPGTKVKANDFLILSEVQDLL